VEPARRQAARRGGHRPPRGLDRARRPHARRLRLRPLGGRPDRHPDHRRARHAGEDACLLRLRGRVGQGPYPIPANVAIEGGRASDGDRHALIVDRDHCRLYELFALYPTGGGRWKAGSGAIWDLRSNRLRPAGWTSADAAGLPILPGLARYEEAARGRIEHALRFTASRTRRAYVWPARHFASSDSDPALPPMGLRVRLKASYPISSFPPQARVVLRALKEYGMILADNGSDWYVSGAPHPKWSNDQLHTLHRVPGSAFEVVDASRLRR
jgi:hypothetical protein